MINFDEVDFDSLKTRHRTAPIPGTMTSVPHFPRKLKVYMHNASPYWWATYYENGRTYRKSCKTLDKQEAFRRARVFYETLLLSKYQHPSHLAKYMEDYAKEPANKQKIDLRLKTIALQWLARKAIKWTEAHKAEVERRLANNVLRHAGDKNIQRISKSDLLSLLQQIEQRGSFNLAKRVLSDCRQIWQFAMVLGHCKTDITAGLGSVLHDHTVKHFNSVTPKELPRLMQDIAKYDKQDDMLVKYALQLVALTFVRTNELLLARWSEFDFNKAIWKIPAERMKMRVEHIVPLSKQALGLLLYIKKLYPSEHYVFYRGQSDRPLVDHALIIALYYLGYKHRMTVHGFRAIASTVLNEHEFRADVIERQLAHAESNQVRRAYNRAQYMKERMEMMQWWGDYLEKMAPFHSHEMPDNRLLF